MNLSRIRLPLAGAALALGATLALAPPANAEVATQADPGLIQSFALDGPLTVDTSGFLAYAPLRITCTAGSYLELGVQIRQVTTANEITRAYGGEWSTCDGSSQRVVLTIPALEHRLLPKEVFARVNAYVCDTSTNQCSSVNEELQTRLQVAH